MWPLKYTFKYGWLIHLVFTRHFAKSLETAVKELPMIKCKQGDQEGGKEKATVKNNQILNMILRATYKVRHSLKPDTFWNQRI